MWNNPYIVGIINALFPGLGYLILRKREVFGLFILTSTVLAFISGFYSPLPLDYFSGVYGVLCNLVLLFAAVGFGYDAYTIARHK